MIRRVTVVRIRRGAEGNVNADLQWLGNSLGLFGLRDKDSSCFRIFITLVRKGDAVSSDEIAERLNLSRGTVVHHLIKLMDSGIVVREKERYLLREQSLLRLIDDLKRDTESVFAELREVAKEIDERIH
ncbi:MAG: helix-turn-helix domain-containing protein [Nanoarchaeota archaeon]|nr:helix-turn-helix domain-containing protein [Nanoarchaeota archaeon]